jgi:hypothetical protein
MLIFGPISNIYGTCVSHIYYDVVVRFSKDAFGHFAWKNERKKEKKNTY